MRSTLRAAGIGVVALAVFGQGLPAAVADSSPLPHATDDALRMRSGKTQLILPGARNDIAADPARTVFASPAAVDGGKRLTTEDGEWRVLDDGRISFVAGPGGVFRQTPPVGYYIFNAENQRSTGSVWVGPPRQALAKPDRAQTPLDVPVTIDVLSNDLNDILDRSEGSYVKRSVRFVDTAQPSSTISDNGKTLQMDDGTFRIGDDGRVTFEPRDRFQGYVPKVTYTVNHCTYDSSYDGVATQASAGYCGREYISTVTSATIDVEVTGN